MDKILGFARIIARRRVGQELNKPVIGKPYLKFGQCFGIWGYCFQLGGILGAKHCHNLDAFGNAFLGATGKPGAIETYFTELSKGIVTRYDIDSTTFSDYVTEEFAQRLKYKGDLTSFFIEHGGDKMLPDQAEELAWQYAGDGAALGTIYPDKLRSMFERQHAAVSKKVWDEARAAGLDIPPQQDVLSYEDIEYGENGVFLDYCQRCCPELFPVLVAQTPENAFPDRQKLEKVIACAISVLYSEEYEFDEAITEIVRRQNVSTLEAYVALSAATSTKDGGSYEIEERLDTLAKAYDEEDVETSLMVRELCEMKAKRDFLTVQMANMFLKIECDAPKLNFGAAVYQAEKLKNGPLTLQERNELKAKHLPNSN